MNATLYLCFCTWYLLCKVFSNEHTFFRIKNMSYKFFYVVMLSWTHVLGGPLKNCQDMYQLDPAITRFRRYLQIDTSKAENISKSECFKLNYLLFNSWKLSGSFLFWLNCRGEFCLGTCISLWPPAPVIKIIKLKFSLSESIHSCLNCQNNCFY